jgi:hypothetical protein
MRRQATPAGVEAEADAEARALRRNPRFRALLDRSAERISRDGALTLNELHEFLALTPDQEAEGEALLHQLKRETETESGAATASADRRNGAKPPSAGDARPVRRRRAG